MTHQRRLHHAYGFGGLSPRTRHHTHCKHSDDKTISPHANLATQLPLAFKRTKYKTFFLSIEPAIRQLYYHSLFTMSATTKVLGTNELLEMILLKLPLRDVLLAQLVCKTWRADITASIDLQRALFFEPEISALAPLTILPANFRRQPASKSSPPKTGAVSSLSRISCGPRGSCRPGYKSINLPAPSSFTLPPAPPRPLQRLLPQAHSHSPYNPPPMAASHPHQTPPTQNASIPSGQAYNSHNTSTCTCP